MTTYQGHKYLYLGDRKGVPVYRNADHADTYLVQECTTMTHAILAVETMVPTKRETCTTKGTEPFTYSVETIDRLFYGVSGVECPESNSTVGTHHMVPKSSQMICAYCSKTTEQITADIK